MFKVTEYAALRTNWMNFIEFKLYIDINKIDVGIVTCHFFA